MDPVTSDECGDYCTARCRKDARAARRAATGGRRRTSAAARLADDRAWRQEMAMEAGMLHGAQGYNDVMGY
jgi:hypothetical protein